MINLQYHKGQACKIKPVLCQEGYCSECFIYQSKYSRMDTAVRALDRAYISESKPALTSVNACVE